ncbi:MAG TPA: PAS domain S-box protein [Gammaproteobacteria bacterium]|nr:PAS domain S-box protein [Gammaproteobacteria bacterium]
MSPSAPDPASPPPAAAQLLAAATGPAVLVGPDDCVRDWNPATAEVLGGDVERLAGTAAADLFRGGKKRSFRSRLRQARESGAAEMTAPLQAGGGPGPELSLRLVQTGDPDHGWVLVLGEAVGEPEPPARQGLCPSLMDALPYGVLVFRGQRLDYANPAAAALLNRGHADDLQGLMMASVIYGEDRERMGQLLGRATESGRADSRLRLLDADHRPVEVEASLALLGERASPTLQLVINPAIRQRGLERALRESEERYRSLIGSLEEGFWMGGGDGGTADVNQVLLDLLGYRRDEMLDRPLPDFAEPGERDRLRGHLNRLEEGEPRAFETRLQRRDGGIVPVGLRMVIMPDPSTGIPALFAFVNDLSARHSLIERLRRETGLNEAILGSLPGIFLLAGSGLELTRWNTNLSRQAGRPALDLAGLPAPELFVEADREPVRALLEGAVAGAGGELEARLQTTAGEGIPFRLSVAPVGLGERGFVAALGVDITERQALEAELQEQATRDALTGAWNRGATERQLQWELERTRRYGNPLSLVLIDLDHFQHVMGHYGRDTGDRVLQDLAALIEANKRATDFLGRWGGDQIMVLAPDTELAGAVTLAHNLHALIDGHDFDPVALLPSTIGVTAYRAGDSYNDLVDRVETILHEGKRRGRNQVMVAEV